MAFRFDGKHALVTGAGKGIGRATAKALYTAGAVTYAISRTQTDLDSLKLECPDMRTMCLDVADWKATRAALETLGPIDLLVNNAAAINYTTVLEASEQDIDVILRTNIKAVMNITQIVAQRMIKRQQAVIEGAAQPFKCRSRGAIVNISSVSSREVSTMFYVYSVSKAGLDQMTRCMAAELGPHQIRVNSVNPCLVMTERASAALSGDQGSFREQLVSRIPVGRPADMADIIHAVLFLLSEQADMINGAILPVDGGQWCK